MASRFWVGGAGNWDAATTTHWAATTGGAGGQSVPGVSDDVFFDGNSGAGTVTITAAQSVLTIDFTGFVRTFAGSSQIIILGTKFKLVPGMTLSWTGSLNLQSAISTVITSAGKTIGSINLSSGTGSAAAELADDLTLNTTFAMPGSVGTTTFDAKNFNVSTSQFSCSNSSTRTVNMGSGTWTITGTGTGWSMATVTGLTLNQDTSTIKFTDSSASNVTFSGGGMTFNNLWFSRGASTGNITISGSNTFADIKDDGSAAHSLIFTAATTQTFTSFHVSGTLGNLITINSTTTGFHTLTCTSGVIACDFLNIQHSRAGGGATFFAGANSTNNQAVATSGSGWIFTAPVYTLSATVGSFLLSGIAASFHRSYEFALSVGSFTLTGIASAFNRMIRLTTSVGTFVFTGIAIALKLGHGISVSVGTFILSGKNAIMSRTGYSNKSTTSWNNEGKDTTSSGYITKDSTTSNFGGKSSTSSAYKAKDTSNWTYEGK